MSGFFKNLYAKLFCKKRVIENTEDDSRRDNLPIEPTPPLPDNEEVEKEDDVLLWYPDRIKNADINHLAMKTRGYYSQGHPEGAVVHFTAGRSRNKKGGGSRNAESHLASGIRGVQNAVSKGSYSYFIIDRDGNVFQQFPLNRWGYHAGKSECPVTGRKSVSNNYVGIEVQNAGKLKKVDNERYMAWFSRPEKGDEYFYKSKGEVKHFQKRDNIQSGYYHLYSAEQKKALVDLVLWLEENGKGVFDSTKVFGHDEISPSRKSDPGGSLDMTMNEFRELCADVKIAESIIIKK